MNDQDTAANEDEKEQNTKKTGKLSKKVLIIIGVFVALQAVVSFFVIQTTLRSGQDPESTGMEDVEVEESQPEPGEIFTLENIVVNPAGTNGLRYLKFSVVFEMENMELVEELTARTHLVTDLLISIFSSKFITEVDTPIKKEKLKQEILDAINAEFSAGEVSTVYFTEFVIQ